MTLKKALGIFGVIVLLVLTNAFYVVDQSEQAIVLRFGAPVDDAIREPGLYFKTPFIEKVRRFEKRLLIWDGDPNQIPTKGREFISVDTTARFRIEDPLLFYESVATEQGAQSRLDDIIDSVVRDKVSGNALIEVVRSTSWESPDEEKLEEMGPKFEQAKK